MTTAAEMVTAIDQAIMALVSHRIQEYDVMGTRYRYQDLDALREVRKMYQQEANASSSSRVRLADIRGTG